MDFKDTKAIYLQIADHICDSILLGEYPEGSKLPSVREYAAQLEVNVNTVTRSFDWLQTHDIAETRRGMGNYVLSGAHEAILALRREEFFSDTLPSVFLSMEILGITMSDIENARNEYLSQL